MGEEGYLVGIGQAVNLELTMADGSAQVYRFTDPATWFAWIGSQEKGTLAIVQTGKRGTPLAGSWALARVWRVHSQFHGDDSDGFLSCDYKEPSWSKLEPVALVDAITYDARLLTKTNKREGAYRHAFGDFGRDGGGMSRAKKYKPALAVERDADGNMRLHIIRRPGNVFTILDWIRG